MRKAGTTVVLKPNIGWGRAPETGVNTNPVLVKRVVEHCHMSKAKFLQFDNYNTKYVLIP